MQGDAGSGDEDAGIVGQQGLLPHNQDPKLWVSLNTVRSVLLHSIEAPHNLITWLANKCAGVFSIEHAELRIMLIALPHCNLGSQ